MFRYVVAATLLRLADEGCRVALVLLGLQRTDDPAVAGCFVAALLVPHVVAAPGIGRLADRVRRPRLLVTAAGAWFAAGLAAVSMASGLPVGVTLAVLVVGGCAGPAVTGALSSQVRDLVDATRLPRAFGADALTYNAAAVAGPALAAVVASVAGAAEATLVLSAVAAVGAVVVATLPVPVRAGGPAAAEPTPLSAGIRTIARRPTLRAVTIASSVGQLGLGALGVVTATLATRAGHPAAAGWLLSSLAVGGMLGSAAWTWRPSSAVRAPRVAMVTLAAVGACLCLAALAPSSVVAVAVLFVAAGLFLGPSTGALFTTRNAESPEEGQAQVFTLSAGLKVSAAAGGAALGGAIAGATPALQLVLAGASPLFAGLAGSVAIGSWRRTAAPTRSCST